MIDFTSDNSGEFTFTQNTVLTPLQVSRAGAVFTIRGNGFLYKPIITIDGEGPCILNNVATFDASTSTI